MCRLFVLGYSIVVQWILKNENIKKRGTKRSACMCGTSCRNALTIDATFHPLPPFMDPYGNSLQAKMLSQLCLLSSA